MSILATATNRMHTDVKSALRPRSRESMADGDTEIYICTDEPGKVTNIE